MKKSVSVIIFIVAIFVLSGCSSGNSSKQNSKIGNDGVTLNATAKIGDVKGDRTGDNVEDPNGEYFADGSNIAKASDYKDIIVTVKATNKTNRTIDISQENWTAELSDDYKFQTTITGNTETIQVQPNKEGSVELHYPVKKDVDAKSIKLSFINIKDEDKYKNMVSEAVNGGNEQQLKSKYKDAYEIYNVQTDIK